MRPLLTVVTLIMLLNCSFADKLATIKPHSDSLDSLRTSMNTPLIIEPTGQADSAIIWLHGLGASKTDFEPVAQILQKQVIPNTRFILPQSPMQAVTLNGGMVMPSWYDIVDLTVPRKINEAQLTASADLVIALIEAERAKGIKLERIILAGFSQGGAVVLHTAYLRYQDNVGGVVALSTYAPTFLENTKISTAKLSIPSLHLHGTQDPVVAPEYGQAAYDFLTAQGVKAQWNDYPMQHEVINDELSDIAIWLHKQLIK